MPAQSLRNAIRRRPGLPALAFGALIAGPLAGPPTPAQAQSAETEETRQYRIPAGPLGEVLSTFAERADILLSADAELTKGKSSPGLKGRYTHRAALDKLLAGTGLEYRFTDHGTVTLKRVSDREARPGHLGEIAVAAYTGSPMGPTGPYSARHSATATKTDTPVTETPASVQVVPAAVMKDQGAQGLEDVYTNVSGVVESGNTLNAQSEVRPVIRGFESQLLFRNGMRATNVGAVDLVNIDSVEVLKGPSSILFGAIEPGGVLNYTTKKPLPEAAYEATAEAGSFDHYRATLDATGPATAAGGVLYRLNAAYTDSGSFRDTVDTQRVAVAPSFMLLPTDRTEVLFDFSYTQEQGTFDSGVPFGADNEPLVSQDTFFGDPDLDGQKLDDYFASYRLNHTFNDTFTLRNQFQFHRVEAENETIRNRGVSGNPGSEELARRYQNLESTDDEYQLITDLIAEFRTGKVAHEVLTGIDLVYQERENRRFRQSLSPIPISDNPPRDIDPPDNQPKEVQKTRNRWLAVYLQDQLTAFDDRLHLLIGGRYDNFRSEYTEDGISSPEVEESEFTGRVGALFEVTSWLSPFTSVSQSFNPQGSFAVDASGNLLPPEEGMQYEAGIKFDFYQERLLANLTAFHLEKKNVAVFDLPHFQDTGEVAFTSSRQRSRGVELDVSGEIARGLRLMVNYAFTETLILENKADPDVEGDRRGNVPKHSFRLWSAYDMPRSSTLGGFGAGAGLRYESERKAQFDGTKLDSFVVYNAAVWYRQPLDGGQVVNAQINFENIADTEYYPRASDQSIVHPGAPFKVMGTIGVTF
jgi:iron complex outermembrane receptor protein